MDTQKAFISFDGMFLPPAPILKENAEKRMGEIRDLDTRDDDVLLCAFPKAGTHWTWEVIGMLVHGEAEYIKTSKISAFVEVLPDMNVLENVPSPRVLNTHVPFRWLPKKHIDNGGKIVHVIRNPKDIWVSAYHHLLSSNDIPGHTTWNDYFKVLINSESGMYGGWFNYEKEMEEAKKTGGIKSIHTLHYENMKKDPETEIRRLAAYLEVECTDKLVKDIADKTDFKKLKEADKTIKAKNSMQFFNKVKGAEFQPPVIYRKGETGDWKNYFTVAQNEQFDAVYAERMKNSDIKVIYEFK